MDIKPVLTYLSNRWAEGSTRRNLVLFIGSGAALMGYAITPEQIEHWMSILNGAVVLAGLLGVFMPDAIPKNETKVLLDRTAEHVTPASDYATPSLIKTAAPLPEKRILELANQASEDSSPGWNG